MYSQLGNIVFKGLKGYRAFQSTRETNFAQHPVIEGKPKLQRVGTNLEELALSIQFHASFCTPETEIAAMESARASATVLPFVSGTGEYFGTFVIKSLRKTMEELGTDGSIKFCTVEIELLEFATSDPLSSANLAAKLGGIANAFNKPLQVTPIARLQSEAATISKPLTSAKSLASAAGGYMNKAKQVASQAAHYGRKAQESLKSMRQQLDEANTAITNAKEVYQSAARMKQAIAETQGALSATLQALEGGSLDDALVANRSLQLAVSRSSAASSEVVNITATRR